MGNKKEKLIEVIPKKESGKFVRFSSGKINISFPKGPPYLVKESELKYIETHFEIKKIEKKRGSVSHGGK